MTTEAEAISALRDGDMQGLETLVHLHQVAATRIAYGITWNREAAEDVVADAFLKVCERIAQLDSTRGFKPWFLRIVTNEALHSIRYRRRFADLAEAEALMDTFPAPDTDPATAAELNERKRLMVAAIGRLQRKERAVIVLFYYADLSERDIAEILGWPLGTVKTRLYRAKQRLDLGLQQGPPAIWEYLPTGGKS